MKTSNTLCNSIGLTLIALGVGACDVESHEIAADETDMQADEDSGTEESEEVADAAKPDAASDAGGELAAPVSGYYVIESIYGQASNVSIWKANGERQSESIISSSSANPGLSAALSPDVVAPSSQQSGDTIVLIDRTNGVLTWVDVETGDVEQQLNVAPGGYYANPQDYVQYNETTAFVPRAEANAASTGDYDKGSDVLVINPSSGEITGSIDLTPAMEGEANPPFAGRAILAGGFVRVLLVGWDGDAFTYAAARMVTIDPESLEIVDVLVFDGIQNCMNLVLAPDGKSLAVGCAGPFGEPEYSAILQVSTEAEPVELLRIPASELGGDQVNMIEFTGPTTLAYTTFGSLDYSTDTPTVLVPDRLRLVDLETATADEEPVFVLEAGAFELGEMRCSLNDERCILTDSLTDGGRLRQFTIDGDGRLTAVTADAEEHVLPPRYMGAF